MPYANPHHRREYRRRYYAENVREILRYAREYRTSNKKKIAVSKHKYYLDNRGRILADTKHRATDKRMRDPEAWRLARAAARRHKSARDYITTRDVVREAKNRPCADCGVKYPYYVMDLDHVRGTKKFNIGSTKGSPTMTAVLAEIAKCDVVCANCHRERTHRRTKG